LGLSGRFEKALRDRLFLESISDKLTATADSPADVVEMLDGKSTAAIAALTVRGNEAVAGVCMAYLDHLREVRPRLTGRDVIALGVPEGERVGAALRLLRRARLEGRTASRADEVALLRRELGLQGG
jgi:tRNA nucleotidyltransferase (CCA-adding enzyme)